MFQTHELRYLQKLSWIRGFLIKLAALRGSPRRIHRGSELPGQNIGRGNAVLLVVLEILRDKHSLRVDDVHTRMRDAIAERARLDYLVRRIFGSPGSDHLLMICMSTRKYKERSTFHQAENHVA
jgi:hypothetical protein